MGVVEPRGGWDEGGLGQREGGTVTRPDWGGVEQPGQPKPEPNLCD